MTASAGRNMPSLTRIVKYWSTDRNAAVFPNLESHGIGWGEPFCFRCGWLAPLPEQPKTKVWIHATGWLDRAHLVDHFLGGVDGPENLVPLCTICHRRMPELFHERDKAIAWINEGETNDITWWQMVTDSLWGEDRFRTFPGRAAFLDTRIRFDEAVRRVLTEQLQAA